MSLFKEGTLEIFYIRLWGFIVSIIMGPWIGFQLFSLMLEKDSEDLTDYNFIYNQIILCLFYFVSSNMILISPQRILNVVLWWFFGLLFIVGHWGTYLYHQHSRDHAHSLSELQLTYVIVTILYLLLIGIPTTLILLINWTTGSYDIAFCFRKKASYYEKAPKELQDVTTMDNKMGSINL